MEVRLLGPLEVEEGGVALPLPRGRARALMALLSVRVGEVVSSDRLIDELWGEVPPVTARTKLHGLVSALRRALPAGPPELLATRPPGYLLNLEPERIDGHRFRRLVAAAREEPTALRADALRRALALWRGAALADFTYEPFAQSEIASLEELRLLALEDRIDADLALGRHHEAVVEIEELVGEHPFREGLWRQRLLALYRCGRGAEALDAYRQLEGLLAESFGVEPGAGLQQLRQRIAQRDPSLHLPAATTPARPAATAEAWLPQSRKPVTVVFAGVARSGAQETADPEVVQRILGHVYDSAAAILERHGGTVEGVIGGVVVAVFGVPVAHEDDAVRAARAALELVAASSPGGELQLDPGNAAVRVGVHTGEVVVGSGRGATAAYGGTVEVASELQRTAAAGEVLVGDTTMRLLVRAAEVDALELAPLDLGGHRVAAWQLRSLTPAAGPRDQTPLVGRRAELDRLRDALERVGRGQGAARIAVIGDAGIGKSRLVRTFAAELADALVVTGHCPAYGEGVTFWPLREIVRQVTGSDEPSGLAELLAGDPQAELIADQLAAATGLSTAAVAATELFPAVRGFFEYLARVRPLVVIFEDVHWAEATLLDLIDYLLAALRRPVLLVMAARPEYLERWPGRAKDGELIWLGPLDLQSSLELITARPEGRLLPRERIRAVLELAAGNPLYLGQMAASLRGGGAEWSLPPSLQALLAARLERLGPAERDVLRCAAVIGRAFSQPALAALVPVAVRPFLERYLRALCDRELLDRLDRHLPGTAGYEFRHALIQLAAYRSLTHRTRAELHQRLADWLAGTGDRAAREADEVIGYHLEQAWQHRREIGLLDEDSAALAARAGEHLAAAGARAFARLDIAAAVGLLTRAKPLLPSVHPQWRATLRGLAQAAQIDGRHGEADAALTELLAQIDPVAEAPLKQRLQVERARIQLFTGPDPVPLSRIQRGAEWALATFRESEDHAAISQATDVLCQVQLRQGRLQAMEQLARLGLDHAHRSGHPRQVVAARFWWVQVLLLGPTTVEACLRSCEELLLWQGVEHPLVLTAQARLRAMVGEFERARRLVARGRWVCLERYHARRPLMFVVVAEAEVEALAGDSKAATTALRTALELASDMGETEVLVRTAAALSRLLLAASEEARELSALARERAPAEHVPVQAAWRSAQVRILVGDGDLDSAESLAREAVALLPEEMPNLRADSLLDLAAVLERGGHAVPAGAARREALALYRRKGNLVAAERTAALVG